MSSSGRRGLLPALGLRRGGQPSRWIAAAGRGQAPAPANAQAFAPAMGAYAPAPQPIDAVHFTLSGDPATANAEQRNAQHVEQLAASSPTFHSILVTATDGGRTPFTVRYGQLAHEAPGEWDRGNRIATIDPSHPSMTVPGTLLGVTVLELVNASASSSLERISQDARDGLYERRASTRSATFTAAELYARDIERVEWQNARTNHQIFTEAATSGMPLEPGADRYAQEFDAQQGGNWTNFSDFYEEMENEGHSHSYEVNYRNGNF